MPFVLDLVRLATSIRLAPDRSVSNDKAAELLIAGYLEGSECLNRRCWMKAKICLRSYAIGTDLESGKFWKKLDKASKYPLIDGKKTGKPPRDVMQLLMRACQKGAANILYRRRIAGGELDVRAMSRSLTAWRPCAARSQGTGAVGLDLCARRATIGLPETGQRQISCAGSLP